MIKKPEPEDYILEHYGIKGMHWGIRRDRRKTSSDYKRTRRLRSKRPYELSDHQLQTLNKRLELERKYKDLNPGPVKKGETYVKRGLALLGTGIAVYNMTQSKLGQKLIEKSKAFLSR